MLSIRSSIKSIVLTVAVLVLPVAMPIMTMSAVHADGDCTPPSSSGAGVHAPTGSDAGTFTYMCDGPYANKWINTYYLYDPATNSRTALYAPDYQYNCSAGSWSQVEWDFWASDGQYHMNRVPASDPGLPTGCPVAASGTSNGSGAANAAGISNTGPGGSSSSTTNGNNNLNVNNTTNATMTNSIGAVATSGNALVLGNTTAGGASSGDTTDIANVVNLLQSSSNVLGSGRDVATFTANIDGDVTGDLILDPSKLVNVQNANSATDLTNNVTINNSTSGTINNNINLAAKSGDATVSSNTTGGNANTGAATAVANIVNSINSALMAGKSFIGTININGNLDGDILLPDNFIDQLLAANVPTVTITAPSSTNNSSTSATNNTTVTNTNNLGITNDVNANAGSGNASVSNNTHGGNATSGKATTNITAFNLTGSNVIGANDILVFVNVHGSWVGVIVNAPPGATAAELGGGITQNTSVANNTDVNNANNLAINNHVTTDAQSGNAEVSRNTTGGNARSGDAHSAVNMLNVENSNLNLTGWLGILFINVFGTWHGSFGVNTDAGNPHATSNSTASGAQTDGRIGQVFRFVPTSGGGGFRPTPSVTGSSNTTGTDTTSDQNGAVLAATSVKPSAGSNSPLQTSHRSRLPMFVIAGGVVGYIVADAAVTRRKALRAQL